MGGKEQHPARITPRDRLFTAIATARTIDAKTIDTAPAAVLAALEYLERGVCTDDGDPPSTHQRTFLIELRGYRINLSWNLKHETAAGAQ